MQTRPRYIATKTHMKHHIIFFWILDIHGMGVYSPGAPHGLTVGLIFLDLISFSYVALTATAQS